MIENIQWLGHGSFLIQGPPFIYINPWRVIRSAFHADVILISHHHYDHCSVADVNKLRGPDTRIIGSTRVPEYIPEAEVLRPWQTTTIDRAAIKAVPAYSPDDPRHPRSDDGLGFLISIKLYDVYYAGDTDLIPEMKLIRPDIAILPIDDDGTLSVERAVDVVRQMRPRWVIPSNWGGSGEGVPEIEARRFARLVGDIAEVVVPSA